MRLLYSYGLDLPAPVAAPIQILHTAHALAERGVDVTTAWRNVAEPDAVLRELGLGPHPRLRLVEAAGGRSLRRAARGCDVVMSRGEHGVRSYAALGGARPFVYETHRPVVSAPRFFARLRGPSAARLEAAAVRGCAGLVGVSRGALEEMRSRHGGHAPELVLPSGTDPPAEGPEPPRDLDVVYAGKVEARKGLGVLLESMRCMPGVTLAVVGGSAPELAALRPAVARAEAAGARIQLVGRVRPAAVRGWFRRARVGVCPLPLGLSATSERFTSPMKIVEMMACGTPIVASDLPSVRELLTDGVNAKLVPPSDPAALAAALRGLLDHPEPALVGRARTDALGLTWAARAEKLHRFLERIA
ncbi:glycosyltransferase family 4 protein [Phycisphaera mikurensis]|uniref:Putative glycosyltransferase n=1 Tax=Phycisphaera mikurensis (strain NBRC 102666 / KCTC 22515 / FYK2301M01) TaxID=1142394 RepID=I0IFD9_PHYMF|nr:glycosyltransferase family 4 protein [Phycisphaera mikurensis]MBB6440630.1 glycosyltransferase involved in cell wall biosynthesis [Phycisphaera mikurensis]BAM03977.1 putative glycosyltransferase [Phycisphaera mikurensis NBRC 102666]